MRPRARLARRIVRLGSFLQESALMVMRPADITDFSRRGYSTPSGVRAWQSPEILESPPDPIEARLLEKVGTNGGSALVLCGGGGRDAVLLASRGFEVTVLDFVPALVEAAVTQARRRGYDIRGEVGEMSAFDVRPASYDLIWLSNAMYSAVPGRPARVAMLKRVEASLRPGGLFFCEFLWDPGRTPNGRREKAKRLLARLSGGYKDYQPGDVLRAEIDFLHVFSEEADLRSEFASAGLEVVAFAFEPRLTGRGGALLRVR